MRSSETGNSLDKCATGRASSLLLSSVLLVACSSSRAESTPPTPPTQATQLTPSAQPGPIASLEHEVGQGVSQAWGVLHREDRVTLQPPPADVRQRPYSLCSDALGRHGIDVDQENAAALRLAQAQSWQRYAFDILIVPGYVALDAREPVRLTDTAKQRLELAYGDYQRGLAAFILTTGGNVHPEGTRFNEALEMKHYLMARGMPEQHILLEPCARHSHTNLRNAGRLMLYSGLRRGLIITSYDQAMYFGRPRTSSFDGRCLSELGYLVGALEQIDEHRVAFQPSGRSFERGLDPLDP